MGATLGIIYVLGALIAIAVTRSRAGLTVLGTLTLGMMLGSLPWTMVTIAKVAAWPIALGVWLVQGRPASPWAATQTRGSLRVVRIDSA